MEWITINTAITSDSYIFTPTVTGTLFKFKHNSPSSRKDNLRLIVRQSFNDGVDSHLFDYRLINPILGESILFINKPRELLNRSLAIKRADSFLSELWIVEIQTLINDEVNHMPSYPSLPIFSGITSAVTANSIPVDATKSVVLSAASTAKIGTIIINNSKSKLYVSVGITASLTVFDKVLAQGEVYETPFNWSGDIFGIWDKADTSSTNNARVKDFS